MFLSSVADRAAGPTVAKFVGKVGIWVGIGLDEGLDLSWQPVSNIKVMVRLIEYKVFLTNEQYFPFVNSKPSLK